MEPEGDSVIVTAFPENEQALPADEATAIVPIDTTANQDVGTVPQPEAEEGTQDTQEVIPSEAAMPAGALPSNTTPDQPEENATPVEGREDAALVTEAVQDAVNAVPAQGRCCRSLCSV